MDLATGSSSVQGVLPSAYKIHSSRINSGWEQTRQHNPSRQKKNTDRILVRKPAGRRPLGRSRRRWVDNIKMHHTEIGWDGTDWSDVAQNRGQWRALVSTAMNLRVA
jgi:hypothetical protein